MAYVMKLVKRLEACPLETLWMTNTIPYTDRLVGTQKIESVFIASLLAHAISCISVEKFLSSF